MNGSGMNVNHDKLNGFIEEEPTAECASTYEGRKWHSNPIGARRYHELVNKERRKDAKSLAQMLLKNIAETKLNQASELTDKGKMTERKNNWLKRNCLKPDVTAAYDTGGFASDSGVSLCTSVDYEYPRGRVKADSFNNNMKSPNKRNIVFDETVTANISKNPEDVFGNNPTRTNDRDNEYEDMKDFYTPRSCWEEVWDLKAKDHVITSEPGSNSKSGSTLSSSRSAGTKRSGKSSDTLTRAQQAQSPSEPDVTSGNCHGVFGMSKPVDLTARYNRPGEIIVKVEESGDTLDTVGTYGIPATNSAITAIRSGNEHLITTSRSVNGARLRQEMKERTVNGLSAEDYPGITKALTRLALVKRSNKNAVSNVLHNVAGSSDEKLISMDSRNSITDQDVAINQPVEFPGSSFSSENMKYDFSSESLKLNFPSSNRKREETLRSLENDVADYDLSLRIQCSGDELLLRNKHSKPKRNHFESVSRMGHSQTSLFPEVTSKSGVVKSDFKISPCSAQKYMETLDEKSLYADTRVSETDIVNLASDLKVCGGDGKLTNGQNIREMNTQAALIYLSQTLIESAQRTEILLMQKMKEYNDLVCRDPPENRRQDFTCQVQVKEAQDGPASEIRLNQVKDKFLLELNDKNKKIRQLENEKKKLKQALKKLNLLPGKKIDGTEIIRRDAEEISCTTPLNVSYEPPTLKETDENQGEFVEALKIENNLLHTLLKEMKAELDQENATILSLAKKLEMSLGKQSLAPLSPSRQQTDVVRKLEDKLEQQEKMLRQEAMEARAVAKYVIMKYKKLIQEYKQKVKTHQETVDKLTNAIK